MLILIVGDKESERAILREAVTRLGHEWREAEDGDQGWLQYLDCKPQVVLSDFIMPGKNGLELCQAVRSQPFEHYTYFVLLSSLAQQGNNVMDGLRSGADDYLSKPVHLDELELRMLSATRVNELHRRLAEQRNELQILSQKLLAESRKDPLTQVGNRLRFNDDTAGFLGQDCCVVLADIDCFKQYNDTYGHLEGDKILKLVAQQLQRGAPHVYRFGGEEFLMIFPHHSQATALPVVEQIGREIEGLGVVHVGNQPYGKLTVTFGLTNLEGTTSGDMERALKEADAALYQGKHAGRNRSQLFRWEPITYLYGSSLV